jgi:hypothetical protein
VQVEGQRRHALMLRQPDDDARRRIAADQHVTEEPCRANARPERRGTRDRGRLSSEQWLLGVRALSYCMGSGCRSDDTAGEETAIESRPTV